MERKVLGVVSEGLRTQFESIYDENKVIKDTINELIEKERAINDLITRLIIRRKEMLDKSKALYEKAVDELEIKEEVEFDRLKIETKTGILGYWE